jgi:hypothetical protein
MFPGLLALKFNPSAFWGLGGEYATSSWLLVGNITASLMTVLAACGCFAQLRSRSAGTAAWLVLVASGAMVMILVSRYSYGAYKLILLGWWALGFALILGTNVVKRLGEGTPRLACVVLIAVALAQTSARERKSVRTAGLWDMDAYRSLVAVERLRLSKATLIAVDDAVANTWAVYFLRDAPAALGRYRSYLTFAHVRPFLDRARQFRPEEIGYILTDQDPERVVDDVLHWQTAWSSGPYRLLAPTRARWAVLGDIRNPYGLETFDAKPFFWMGPEPTTLEVLSGSDGILTLQAYFHPGPSVPSSRERRLLLTTDSGHRREVQVGAGPATFRVPTSAGADRVVMQVLDQPTAPAPVRDPRSLLLGVQDLRIGVAGDSVEIRHIANANGSERLDGRPFFWLGAGDTVVTLDASKAGTARLVADFLAGPGGPPQSGRRIRIVADGARARELTVGPGRNALVFPVRAGENRVVLRALDPPVRANNGASDTRSLLMGLRVLRIDLADAPVSSAIIEQIDNPNGLEHVGGEPFLWIGGRRPTRIVVRTDEDGELLLSGRFSFGPSRSNGAVRRLAVALNGGPPRIVTIAPGQQAIPIFVRRGPTELELTAVDAPQVATLPNGDTRPLIVGVSGLTVLLEATTAGRSSQPVAR